MAETEFEEWLSKKLDSFEIDSETYVSYLIEILKDEDEDPSELSGLVKETLESVTDQDIGEFSTEIMTRWEKLNNNDDDDSALKEAILEQETTTHLTDLVSSHLHLAQKQAKEEKKEIVLSAERKSVKESVLALYNSMQPADGYDDEDEEGGGRAEQNSDDDEDLVRNTNAQAVSSAERGERERRKEESVKKKEKDKLDLESQKLKKIERKDKEKKRTAKRERGGGK